MRRIPAQHTAAVHSHEKPCELLLLSRGVSHPPEQTTHKSSKPSERFQKRFHGRLWEKNNPEGKQIATLRSVVYSHSISDCKVD